MPQRARLCKTRGDPRGAGPAPASVQTRSWPAARAQAGSFLDAGPLFLHGLPQNRPAGAACGRRTVPEGPSLQQQEVLHA